MVDLMQLSSSDHFRITCRSDHCQVRFSLYNQTTSVDSFHCARDDYKSCCAAKSCSDKVKLRTQTFNSNSAIKHGIFSMNNSLQLTRLI